MKTLATLIALLATLSAASGTTNDITRLPPEPDKGKNTVVSQVSSNIQDTAGEKKIPEAQPRWVAPKVKHTYEIGAYHPSSTNYNFKSYDRKKTTEFLASISDQYSDGDIVSVDGLKWVKKQYDKGARKFGFWKPFPNPPIPVYDREKESPQEHFRKYAEWINDHPHFNYPPLPIPQKQPGKM